MKKTKLIVGIIVGFSVVLSLFVAIKRESAVPLDEGKAQMDQVIQSLEQDPALANKVF